MLRSERTRFGLALVVLLGFYVLGALDESVLVRSVAALGSAGIVALVAFSPATPARLRTLAAIAVVVGAVAGIGAGFAETDSNWYGVTLAAISLVLAVALLGVIAAILHHDHVTLSTVMGALVAYTLLAFVAATLYRAVDVFGADPFFAQGAADPSVYSYFALVTQTTVGFGDYTAGTELGQRLVAVHALIGQVFLVVLVARLVALWGQPLRPAAGEQP